MAKWRLFEAFVRRVLIFAGFLPIKADGLVIFKGRPGIMVQGLGQPHNADVLLDPPFQTPFYFKTRILVECKDYNKKIGLTVVRNALGLREDVNHFEIIDRATLSTRKNIRRRKLALADFDRVLYQVAVASSKNFSIPAQEFAYTHRIQLINFDHIPNLDRILSSLEKAHAKFQEDEVSTEEYKSIGDNDEIQEIINSTDIAIMNSGSILFLYKDNNTIWNNNNFELADDEFTIRIVHKQWYLVLRDKNYKFSLPSRYYETWIKSLKDHESKMNALKIKLNYFDSLTLFSHDKNPKIVNLSRKYKNFLEEEYKQF